MPEEKLICPAEALRDEDGWWFHPDVPDFEGDEDPAPFYVWIKEQQLEIKQWSMERDLDDHPYWEMRSGCCGCHGWDPQQPGPEWFLLGIFDTQDGPYVTWVRRPVTP